MNVALPLLMFLLGLATGGGAIWFVFRKLAEERLRDKDVTISQWQAAASQKDGLLQQRDEENTQLKQRQEMLETTLRKDQEKFDEKIKLLSEAEKQFKDAFKLLASEALKENNKEFDNLSKPVKEALKELNTKITVVNESATNLGTETSKLVQALRKPDVRGQWGEMHLERVLEMTGLSERCDYVLQHVIQGEGDSKLRPDVVVRLPGERQIAVDAKATLQAFLDLADAPDDDARSAKLQEFVAHVRERIKLLSSKAYHQNLEGSPDFVVLYLPTEGLFCAALSLDAELLEFADSKRVLLAGPINLIALLRSVAHGWKQDDVATNAREICQLAGDLYKRLATFGGHMTDVGKHLNNSVVAYDAAVGSLDRNVMPQARRFEKLGAAPADKRIPEFSSIEKKTRSLQSDEFKHEQANGELDEQEALARPR